jgi:hypothetical protein
MLIRRLVPVGVDTPYGSPSICGVDSAVEENRVLTMREREA